MTTIDTTTNHRHHRHQVSFETPEEWSIVKSFMSGAGIKEIWTSGRLCDAEVLFDVLMSFSDQNY